MYTFHEKSQKTIFSLKRIFGGGFGGPTPYVELFSLFLPFFLVSTHIKEKKMVASDFVIFDPLLQTSIPSIIIDCQIYEPTA